MEIFFFEKADFWQQSGAKMFVTSALYSGINITINKNRLHKNRPKLFSFFTTKDEIFIISYLLI